MDKEKALQYEAICKRGVSTRCAFAAAHFGEYSEAVFWLQLPRALALLSYGSAGPGSFWRKLDKNKSTSAQAGGSGITTSEVQINKLDRGMTFISPKITIPSAPEGELPAAPFKLVNTGLICQYMWGWVH